MHSKNYNIPQIPQRIFYIQHYEMNMKYFPGLIVIHTSSIFSKALKDYVPFN